MMLDVESYLRCESKPWICHNTILPSREDLEIMKSLWNSTQST